MRIIDIIKKLTTKNESNGIAFDNETPSAPKEQNGDSNDEETVTKELSNTIKAINT